MLNFFKCLPDSGEFLETVRDLSRSAIARGRIFIRMALNGASINEYIAALTWNTELVRYYRSLWCFTFLRNFYRDFALLADEESYSIMLLLLENLKSLQLSLFVKEPNFEKINYWSFTYPPISSNFCEQILKFEFQQMRKFPKSKLFQMKTIILLNFVKTSRQIIVKFLEISSFVKLEF